jgi:hypothetical protein
MFRCPHCQALGLDAVELALSTSWSPAHCKACGERAHTREAVRFASVLVFELLLCVSAAMALYFWSWWPFALLVVAAVGFPFAALVVPAVPTTPRRVETARWIHHGLFLLFVGGFAYAARSRA